MAIGQTGRHKFYIVRKEDDPPTTQSKFVNYSGRWLKWNIKGNISQVLFFEGIMAGTPDTDDIKAGNLLYCMSGSKLIGKFVIDRPIYKNDRTIEIKGFQSTGSEQLNKKLLSIIMEKTSYNSETLSSIFTGTSPNGILIDTNGNDIIVTGTIDGSTNKYTMKFDYVNRISSVQKACVLAHKEWSITHGANDSSPYSDGDSIDIKDRVGSASSTYTFYLSGINRNCSFSTGNEETDSIVNDCIVTGSDQNGSQVEARAFDSTGTKTYLDGAIDSWLYDDLPGGMAVMSFTFVTGSFIVGEIITGGTSTATATLTHDESFDRWSVDSIDGTFSAGETVTGGQSGVTATFGSFLSNLGCVAVLIEKGHSFPATPFMIKIDSERILIQDVTSLADYDQLNVVNPVISGVGIYGRGKDWAGTYSVPHKEGADVVLLGSSVALELGKMDITVLNTSGFPASGYLRVGSERIEYSSILSATKFRIAGSGVNRDFGGSYSHGDGIRVQPYAYTPDSPDATTTNSIRTNGTQSTPYNETSAKTRDALDRKAQSIIENKGDVTRIQLNAGDYFATWLAVSLGDTVTLNNASVVNLSNGSYRIMGFEYSFDYGQTNLIYHLNDNSVRTWAQTDYTYVDDSASTEDSKSQKPTRDSDDSRYSETTGVGTEQSFSLPAQFKNVIDPSDAYDAVNKKYVDERISTAPVDTSKWEAFLSDSAIRPKSSRNVVMSNQGSSPVGTTGMIYYDTGDDTFYGYIDEGWVDLVSAPVTNYWTRVTGAINYLKPLYISDSVVPSGGLSYLGLPTNEWEGVYASYMETFTDETRWSTYYVGTTLHKIENRYALGTTLLEIDGTTYPAVTDAYLLGTSSYQWIKVYAQSIETSHSTTTWQTNYAGDTVHRIDNADASFVTKLEVEGNIKPTTNLTFDLGESGYYWNNIRGSLFHVDDRITFDSSGGLPTIYASSTYGIRIQHNSNLIAQFGNSYCDLNRATTVSNTLTVSSTATFNGDVLLGNASGDNISFGGYVHSDVIPDAAWNLGAYSYPWFSIYANLIFTDTLDASSDVTISGTTYFYGAIGTDLVPNPANNWDVGTALQRWDRGYFNDVNAGTLTANTSINLAGDTRTAWPLAGVSTTSASNIAPLNLPIHTSTPGSQQNGDVWLYSSGGTYRIYARIGGVDHYATLS
jgi:hypothetical protein